MKGLLTIPLFVASTYAVVWVVEILTKKNWAQNYKKDTKFIREKYGLSTIKSLGQTSTWFSDFLPFF